jgi:hypothetical protein
MKKDPTTEHKAQAIKAESKWAGHLQDIAKVQAAADLYCAAMEALETAACRLAEVAAELEEKYPRAGFNAAEGHPIGFQGWLAADLLIDPRHVLNPRNPDGGILRTQAKKTQAAVEQMRQMRRLHLGNEEEK